MRNKLVSVLVILPVLLLLPLPAFAQGTRNDTRLLRDVAQSITHYTRFSVFDDVEIGVDQGVVVLTGKVTMPFKQEDIGRIVRQVPGVAEVRNQIDVLPVSFADAELRQSIARAIYGNPSFWQYASMPNPPVHIIVERGHVTLTGVVANEVERTLAKAIASSSCAFSVQSRLRIDAEMRATGQVDEE